MSGMTGQREAAANGLPAADANTEISTNRGRSRAARAQITPNASDDEILGIGTGAAAHSIASGEASVENGETARTPAESQNTAELDTRAQAVLDSSPEARRAWQEAQSYRESFATPEEARAATALLKDLDRVDALFFSRRTEDHAELARAVASLDPVAFASFANAVRDLTTSTPAAQKREPSAEQPRPPQDDSANRKVTDRAEPPNPTAAQVDFLHSANAAAVQGVLDAIETQIDRLLPQGVSKTARNRVIGEIYRELDASLGSNRQLGQQMREAFRSGNLDTAHQNAIVALVTGRARQALPTIAKRVLNEWTSTVVAANQDRLARQRAAAHRVDIAGSGRGGDGGHRSLAPRDIDYARMSDSDILNL